MRKLLFLILNILFTTSILYGQSHKIAVFYPIGIDNKDAIALARETLVERVVENKTYTLIPQDIMQKVLIKNKTQLKLKLRT